jgi:hypothetical protein
MLDVLVFTAIKISVSVLHGGKSASNSLYWSPAMGPALPYLNNKYLTETKEITNTIAYFLKIWQSLKNFMQFYGIQRFIIILNNSLPLIPILSHTNFTYLFIYLLILYIL